PCDHSVPTCRDLNRHKPRRTWDGLLTRLPETAATQVPAPARRTTAITKILCANLAARHESERGTNSRLPPHVGAAEADRERKSRVKRPSAAQMGTVLLADRLI